MNVTVLGRRVARRGGAAILGIAVLGAAQAASGVPQVSGAAYPQMAAAAEYLAPNSAAEISLARSAAPPAISESATVLVLSSEGYRTAVKGTNGFTCLVERAWMSPFDSPDFWNPKLRGPVCYNAAATRSILPITRFRTRLAQSGVSKDDMFERIRAAIARKELPAPESGAMSFMMSKDGYLGDAAGGPWHSHLMFYIPGTDISSWAANLPGSPVVVDDSHHKIPERQVIFMVPVSHWSDGSLAPAAGHAAEGGGGK